MPNSKRSQCTENDLVKFNVIQFMHLDVKDVLVSFIRLPTCKIVNWGEWNNSHGTKDRNARLQIHFPLLETRILSAWFFFHNSRLRQWLMRFSTWQFNDFNFNVNFKCVQYLRNNYQHPLAFFSLKISVFFFSVLSA